MPPNKRNYVLTVKCKLCNFQVTQEVQTEPENLIQEKTGMVKQAASIHPKHPDIRNFDVY
jgi:hypothetical protein